MLNIFLIKSDFLKTFFLNNSLNIINIGPFHKGSTLFLKFNSSTHYFFDHHFQKAFFENKLNWPPVNFQVFLILVRIFPPLKIIKLLYYIYIFSSSRMIRRCQALMPKVSGPLTSSKVSKRLLQFTPPVGVAKLSCQTREKCMVSHIFFLTYFKLFRDCRVE